MLSFLSQANHFSAPKCIEFCRGTNSSYAVLEALKCTCATEHSIDLTKPVVTAPLASGETNPIRPFGHCGRSPTMTMIGSASSPETIAMYRVDYEESYSSEVSKYHGAKIGPTTCFAPDKEVFITR